MLTRAEVPPAVVAFTVTVPAVCDGEVTLIWVVLTKVTEPAGMAVPPNVTVVAPETNPLPVIVTVVPPAVGPAAGVTLVMVGAPVDEVLAGRRRPPGGGGLHCHGGGRGPGR